ncbi:hypothetical protein MHK_007262 [Candidatus Magnetomorum sp. HK-1]|nr:hypothetical protein MHK_007262 [Candidatus Magnetomorum sp. HK-1]
MNQSQFVQIYKTQNEIFVVGRDTFFKQVLSLLPSPEENGAFLFGQRGIGKTSALNGLCAFINQLNVHIPIYIDPSEYKDASVENILLDIMSQAIGKLGKKFNKTDNPIYDFEHLFLPMIREQLLPERRLLICVDEFGPEKSKKTKSINPFYLFFKDIESKLEGELFFILTGGRNTSDLTDIYLSTFTNLRLHKLLPMNFVETKALVRQTERNNSIQWPEKIIHKIHTFSGGFPILTDAVSRELRNLPYGETLNATIPGVMQRYENTMEWIWEGLNQDEQIVVACIAESKQRMSQWQIEQSLNETRTSLFFDRLKNAIQMLEIWQIISQNSDGYAIKCSFISEWIRKVHPVQTILEDINYLPQVSDYLFQAAYQLFQINRIDDAIQVGQHIINIHPEHIEANQMVADIMITQDRCIEAQKILENLYQINSEAAKSRLIHALKIQAEALESLYGYTIGDYRHTPINSYLKNIKLRYSELKDQNNHLLIVYEKILSLAPDIKDIHEKYVRLILKHQKIKDYQRKLAYEKDVLSNELNAYLLTEATSKVKQLQNRILFTQIYLKALDALSSKDNQKATDLFVRVVYMDEKCKDARRFLYLSQHYSPKIESAIQETLSIQPPLPSTPTDTNSLIEVEAEIEQIPDRVQHKNSILLWIFLILSLIIAAYIMMDGTLK